MKLLAPTRGSVRHGPRRIESRPLAVALTIVALLSHGCSEDNPSSVCPSGLDQLGVLPSGGPSTGLTFAGNAIYLSDGNAGLRIINVATPSAPTEQTVLMPGGAEGVAQDVLFNEDTAYVAGGPAGVSVLDASDPLAPTEVTVVPLPGLSTALELHEGRLLSAQNFEGLSILDLTDPRAPSEISNLPGTVTEVESSSFGLYTNGQTQVRSVDLNDPSMPLLAGAYTDEMPPNDGEFAPGSSGLVAASGALFFGNGGFLYVLDFREPQAASRLATLEVPDQINASALEGQCLFVGYNDGGLSAIDLSDVTSPFIVFTIGADEFNGAVNDVVSIGDLLYVADRLFGLRVFAWSN
ncbi:MAG: hypothetical protein AAGF12_10020 [Myxococcota bacterium]